MHGAATEAGGAVDPDVRASTALGVAGPEIAIGACVVDGAASETKGTQCGGST